MARTPTNAKSKNAASRPRKNEQARPPQARLTSGASNGRRDKTKPDDQDSDCENDAHELSDPDEMQNDISRILENYNSIPLVKSSASELKPATTGKRTKKNTAHDSPFRNQKESLYASIRKASKDLSVTGVKILYLEALLLFFLMTDNLDKLSEDSREATRDLRRQDSFSGKSYEEFRQLCLATENAYDCLSGSMDSITSDIAVRRANDTETGLQLVHSHSERYGAALKKSTRLARGRVEELRKLERDASDASALIKHYKRLLYV